MRGSLGPGLLATLVLSTCVVLVPSPAAGFGTIEGGGQHREHERITRAAVACPGDDCFEPRSVDQLAGHGTGFGAVGSPDLTEVSNPAAHCDDADYLAGDYPRTRDEATARLLECVDHLRVRFGEAVDGAKRLLDDEGEVVATEVGLDADCELGAAEQRAKCVTLEAFGRALHGAQDFYSHSNWADVADPARPVGVDNPPGLHLPAPSPVLDLRGSGTPSVPPDLTTGCFVLRDSVPGVGMCERRITHAGLNKDNGLVDPSTGGTTDPTTPRGEVADNFASAVTGAMGETRHQWDEFQVALEDRYGREDGSRMACALTHDDPVSDCQGPNRTVIALVISALVVGVLGIGILAFRMRRRRRH